MQWANPRIEAKISLATATHDDIQGALLKDGWGQG